MFAFSSFVMPALKRLQPARGIEAMQSINVMAPTPVFMTAVFGTAALCAVLAVWGIFTLDEDYGVYLLIGGLFYLAGTIGLTMGYHVPRNTPSPPLTRTVPRQRSSGVATTRNGPGGTTCGWPQASPRRPC
jgi:uncharacterized membrane protein